MTDYRYITYEELDEGRVARITMNRPQYRNAQNRGLLVEVDEAFVRAERDDQVRVVILGGAGKSFSSGHDMLSASTPDRRSERDPDSPDFHPSFGINGATRESVEKRMLQEHHYFYQNTLRWRNLRKITIAQVQGPVFAAGLMLMWACDLIIAADDATFCDPVGTRLGMCGVEYFGHPWEFGPRRAKEMLLLAETMDAHEARRIGMVNRVVARDRLEEETLRYAQEVAKRPTMTALMIKESVNQTLDNQGFHNSLQAAFSLHQITHAHWAELHQGGVPHATVEDGAVPWKKKPAN
ncbi:enoyl-CoA hydratase [Phytohabitans suffuscus]|uniref:Putative enoyl-CoA hydratase EchA13 n=1 Tax=Phytohabitans suffuscus TaxID=624315 RepID=A0A6F8YUR3_9ACTN|nr:enoyl-CoA hydratase [Phytohabitans suffuscus]BCB89824.1 putative enoyl-CoA hydratase EchA13 [Phytohabitans suffuscus]